MSTPSQQPKKLAIPTALPSRIPPEIRGALNTALLQSGAIPRLQTTLNSSLASSGYTAALQEYIQTRLRENSEDPPSTAELMQYIMAQARLVRGIDQHGRDAELSVPRSVVEGAVEALKLELDRLCEITDDDD